MLNLELIFSNIRNYFSVGRFRPPDKYSYEIGRLFEDPLNVHSLNLSIESSRTKEVVFVFIFQSEVIFWI